MAAINDDDFQGGAQGVEGVRNLTEMYRQKQQTRRIITICSSVTLLGACALTVFAPVGRETEARVIGGILTLLSIGVIGVTTFSMRYGKLQVRGGRSALPNPTALWQNALGRGSGMETPNPPTEKKLSRQARKFEKQAKRTRYDTGGPPHRAA